jgi:hypothetical protein
MTDRPSVSLGDWIRVGSHDCVVSYLTPSNDPLGDCDCEVVFNSSKPTNRDVKWTGDSWQFVERPDYGGYADKYDRLRQYVRILKSGRG